MNSLVRWWGRYRSTSLLVFLVLGAAGLIRVNQGRGLADINRWFVWPFKTDGRVQQQLLDAQTKALQQRIQELETQNRSLKTLLNLPVLPQRQKITAPVLSRSADNWWQQLTIGKGSADGIQIDAVVVAPGGLVGRVMSVTAQTSRVLLVSDPNSQIGVTVSRSRQTGILQGYAERSGVLNFFDKAPNVKLNDTIVTSTLSSRFPPGIAIGRVTELHLEERPRPRAVVEFTVPIENVEWVNVLGNG